jgi:hypothetical protein
VRMCSATTLKGEQCRRPAQSGDLFCIGHDPTKAETRKRWARSGGGGRANHDVRAVKKLMQDLTDRVLNGELEPAILYAAVAAQNTLLKAVELERRIFETDELAAEIEVLRQEIGLTENR